MTGVATARVPWIARVNPVTKLAVTLVIAAALVPSLDPVSAGVALALEFALLPWAGVGWRDFWRRTIPVWVAAPLAGVTILLYGRSSGEVYARWLFVVISDGSIELAIATALRVVAIGMPGIVLFSTVDLTAFADSLAQLLRLPARFVLGALAGLRLLGLLLEDWTALELARRARGVGDRGRIRRLPGQAFALLVLSVRRGSALATAMEARGFGGTIPRTWARASVLRGADAVLLGVGVAVAATSVTAAVVTGEWNVLVGP